MNGWPLSPCQVNFPISFPSNTICLVLHWSFLLPLEYLASCKSLHKIFPITFFAVHTSQARVNFPVWACSVKCEYNKNSFHQPYTVITSPCSSHHHVRPSVCKHQQKCSPWVPLDVSATLRKRSKRVHHINLRGPWKTTWAFEAIIFSDQTTPPSKNHGKPLGDESLVLVLERRMSKEMNGRSPVRF